MRGLTGVVSELEEYEELSYYNQHKDPQTTACRRLWASVFRVGLQDAADGFKRWSKMRAKKPLAGFEVVENDDHRHGLQWLFDEKDDVGSFTWLCEMFEYDPDAARSMWRMNVRQLIGESDDVEALV